MSFFSPAPAIPEYSATSVPIEARASMKSVVQNERAPRVTKKPFRKRCNNNLAVLLHDAGFRGDSLRTAWAIVMRESKGQNLDENSPYFTGALGIFQVQTSAWSGKPWWSRSAMLDPRQQARIVYTYMSDNGTDFSHWGLTPQGNLDATYYSGWSSWQHENWIMAPFRKYYSSYPC